LSHQAYLSTRHSWWWWRLKSRW